jgi:GDP-D-mannose dehydratase
MSIGITKTAAAITGVTGQDGAYLAENLLGSASRRVAGDRGRRAAPANPSASAVTVRNVQVALDALGIEFLNHSRPGAR